MSEYILQTLVGNQGLKVDKLVDQSTNRYALNEESRTVYREFNYQNRGVAVLKGWDHEGVHSPPLGVVVSCSTNFETYEIPVPTVGSHIILYVNHSQPILVLFAVP